MSNKYITIPTEVEALQFKKDNLSELVMFTECSNFEFSKKGELFNCLITINGTKLLVIEGNFVVKKSDKTISVMTEEVFNKNYIKKE